MSTPFLAIALLLFLAVGMSAGRSILSREDYFVAGRRGSVFAIAGSLFATIVGGSATIGVAGLVYQRGLTGVWWSLVGVLGLAVLAFVFVARIRAYRVYTLPGLVERLYGRSVSILVAALVVVAWTGVVSGQIVAAARVFGAAGIADTSMWMVAFSAVLILYAIVGGQRAILRTDALQTCLIIVGLSMAVGALLLQVGISPGLAAQLRAEALRFPVSEEFGWFALVKMVVLVGSVYVVGPDIYTRVFSARDTRTARTAVLWAAVVAVPAALLVATLGLSARVLASGISPEEALPWLMSTVLPTGTGAVLFVALVAALMSSADSTLLGQGIVLAQDVIGRLKILGEKQAVYISRICVAALGLLALVLALSLRGVIDSLMFAYSIFTSGVVGPVLVGLLAREGWRPGSRAAFAGVGIGGACGLLGTIPCVLLPGKSVLPLLGFGLSMAVPLAVVALHRASERREA